MDYEDRHALVSLVSFKNAFGAAAAAAEDEGDDGEDDVVDDDDDEIFFSSVKRGVYGRGQVSGC